MSVDAARGSDAPFDARLIAVRGQPLWVAAVLGVGLIPVAFELTNYYYAILLLYGTLAVRRPGVGAALCAVSAASWGIVEHWQWRDEIMTWSSLLVVIFVVGTTSLFLRRSAGPGGSRS